jgi:hypothetical protein
VLVGSRVVSVSIDATIRQWSLKPTDLRHAREVAKNPQPSNEQPPKQESILTEEEERDLAALMGDGD